MGHCVNMKSSRQSNGKSSDDGRTKNCLDDNQNCGQLTFICLQYAFMLKVNQSYTVEKTTGGRKKNNDIPANSCEHVPNP